MVVHRDECDADSCGPRGVGDLVDPHDGVSDPLACWLEWIAGTNDLGRRERGPVATARRTGCGTKFSPPKSGIRPYSRWSGWLVEPGLIWRWLVRAPILHTLVAQFRPAADAEYSTPQMARPVRRELPPSVWTY